MSAHTPRPWQIVERETFADSSVCPRHIVGGPDELQVCYLESQYAATNSTPVTARRDADGRLIAAAPELLEALKAWDRWDYEVQSAKANGESVYSFQDLVDMRVKASQLSYAAIAKATGAA